VGRGGRCRTDIVVALSPIRKLSTHAGYASRQDNRMKGFQPRGEASARPFGARKQNGDAVRGLRYASPGANLQPFLRDGCAAAGVAQLPAPGVLGVARGGRKPALPGLAPGQSAPLIVAVARPTPRGHLNKYQIQENHPSGPTLMIRALAARLKPRPFKTGLIQSFPRSIPEDRSQRLNAASS